MESYIDKLARNKTLKDKELLALLENNDKAVTELLFQTARTVSQKHFGNKIFTRGLIEISNYCKNDCYYCGIRKSNQKAERYRLTQKEILDCCKNGYSLGFRTFVLQGGEDAFFSVSQMESIIRSIRKDYPDCAITLSLGEYNRETYERFYSAGANRYLLRHETANETHYQKLHPPSLSLSNRKKCLFNLKEIGYQVGTGFLVGSPYQTTQNLLEDFRFLEELQPHMIGIGPFLSHKDTPFAKEENGSLSTTLTCIAILRLMFPYALIPSTTALGTIVENGRELGILAGANVVMPNLSPIKDRKKYMLYDNKICTGEEAAECKFCLNKRMQSIGYEIVSARGDYQSPDMNIEIK